MTLLMTPLISDSKKILNFEGIIKKIYKLSHWENIEHYKNLGGLIIMKKIAVLFMVLVLSLALVGCIGGDDDVNEFYASGQIETDTDMPVGGIRLVVDNGQGDVYTTITDENGRYSFNFKNDSDQDYQVVPTEILGQEGGNYRFEPAVIEIIPDTYSTSNDFELKQ